MADFSFSDFMMIDSLEIDMDFQNHEKKKEKTIHNNLHIWIWFMNTQHMTNVLAKVLLHSQK